jgi:predicted transcriptional regulator
MKKAREQTIKTTIELNYEKARQEFSCDFQELLREKGLTYKDIAQRLGCSVTSLRKKVQSDELSLHDLVELSTALQGTCRILIILPIS